MYFKTINTIHNKLQAFLQLLEFRIIGSAERGRQGASEAGSKAETSERARHTPPAGPACASPSPSAPTARPPPPPPRHHPRCRRRPRCRHIVRARRAGRGGGGDEPRLSLETRQALVEGARAQQRVGVAPRRRRRHRRRRCRRRRSRCSCSRGFILRSGPVGRPGPKRRAAPCLRPGPGPR
jgi:hypothetical protein